MALSTEEVLAGLAELVNDETGIATDSVELDKSFTDDLDIDSISMMTIVVNAEEKHRAKRLPSAAGRPHRVRPRPRVRSLN
jgi:acyl carrier protein